MTFNAANWCFAHRQSPPRGAGWQGGEAGELAVAWVETGRCAFTDFTGSALAVQGNSHILCAAAAPAALVWQAAGVAHVVLLSGMAAAAFAETLNGPLACADEQPKAAHSLRQLFETAENAAGVDVSAAAYSLLCRLAGACRPAPALRPPLVEAALACIHEHYGELYGVEELAQDLQVSKGHLIRSFTASLGTSPGRYLTLARVGEAKRLLAESDLPLEMIAGLCGFSGANYLCKVFRAHTGESPAAWRFRTAGRRRGDAPPAVLEEQIYL